MPKPALTFKKHQPERRRGGVAIGVCACCCCCCCLHTIGGLIGPLFCHSSNEIEYGAKVVYWRCVGLLTLAAIGGWGMFSHDDIPTRMVMIFVGLPAAQLAASVVSMFWVQFTPSDTRSLARWMIVKLFGATVFGAMGGWVLLLILDWLGVFH